MPTYDAEVERWAQELLGASARVSPLSGGANNHLFRCRAVNGELVIKRYRDQNFGADVSRRVAEVTFLRHAAVCAPDFVPKLLAVHDQRDMIAISFVKGDPYREGADILQPDIEAATRFYRQLNDQDARLLDYPIPARDGYRSISEHLIAVEQRLAALSVAHLPPDLELPAQSALDEAWRRLESARDTLQRAMASGQLVDPLPQEYGQLSPGDFGFHNAIWTGHKSVFVDFEYAGLDDPAKTLADFFLQPRIPVNPRFFDRVAEEMSVNISAPLLKSRARLLGRLLSVKWMAIVLAPLDKVRFESFALRFGSESSPEIFRRVKLVARRSIFE